MPTVLSALDFGQGVVHRWPHHGKGENGKGKELYETPIFSWKKLTPFEGTTHEWRVKLPMPLLQPSGHNVLHCILPNRDREAWSQRPAGVGHSRSASHTSSHGYGINLLWNHSAAINKGTPPLTCLVWQPQNGLEYILHTWFSVYSALFIWPKKGPVLLYSVDKTKIGTLKALLSVQSLRPNVRLMDDKARLWDQQITSNQEGWVWTVTGHCHCFPETGCWTMSHWANGDEIFLPEKKKREDKAEA